MKTFIHVDSYKVINAYMEHVKRLKVSSSKFKLIITFVMDIPLGAMSLLDIVTMVTV